MRNYWIDLLLLLTSSRLPQVHFLMDGMGKFQVKWPNFWY